MATTTQTFTGTGSQTQFSIAFSYRTTADVKATINAAATTAFSVSGSTVTFNSAPANGAAVVIFRETDNDTIEADFQSGSALRAVDLNDNFEQLLFVTQESTNTANTADTNASAAVTTANTASTNATTAVNTANAATTTANSATSTANSAVTTANSATATANAATTTANTASTNATNAVNTANTASTNATNAVNTANTASTNASSAVTTANTASTNASSAVTTANSASATATAAQNAVANAVLYDPVANVAAIPGSPSNGDYVEVNNSTGIQSFSPLSGMPAGFIGDSGLVVRLKYVTSPSATWVWQNYYASDSESRYLKDNAAQIVDADINASAAIGLSKLATGALPSGITVASANITDGTIVDADISGSAAIGLSKLATGALPTAITITTDNISGGLSIVNADVNASAAIAGTKISPDFGSQAITTTGTASFGAGGFAIDGDGEITTNIKSQGHIELDSTGAFTSPKIKLFANNGNATIAGDVTVGGYDGSSTTTDGALLGASGGVFSQLAAATASTGVVFQGMHGSTFTSRITADGSATFEGDLTIADKIIHSGDTNTAIRFPAADTVSVETSGSEALRVDSSGRVGIGNSNPGGYNSIMDDLVVGNHTGAHGITICAQNNNYGSLTFADGTSGSAEQRAGRVAYHHTTNTMRFYTTNSERARIDSSGRLFLGTTDTSSIASAIIQGNSFGTDSYGLFRLTKGSTTPADGDTLGMLAFGDSNHATAAQISCQRDGGTWTSGSSHPTRLVFSTAPNGSAGASTRMIIDSAGQTVFNYASALGGGVLSLAFNGASQNGFVMQNTGSGTGNAIVFRNNSSSMVGNIVISSSATAYNTSSDYRLKENVVDINDGITRLKQLQPKRFNFIVDADTTIDGFIAHEAQTVVPEAVTGTKDEVDKDGEAVFQGIDQSKLVPLLTAALQEAIAKIETLETKVAALEAT